MNIDIAKELVIKAGIKLVDSGLIARTWGNVSCRISGNSFVITPSGRDYLTLTPDQIVTVKIADCSYDGNIKPSSEKGIHAEVYKIYPNINFVIHTHQENASVISASELNSIMLPGITEEFASTPGVTASMSVSESEPESPPAAAAAATLKSTAVPVFAVKSKPTLTPTQTLNLTVTSAPSFAATSDPVLTLVPSPTPSTEVLCAAYGLPGTKKLCQNVSKALSNTKARAVIMKHHGALCFGENFEETFATAAQLEIDCYDFIYNKYLKLRDEFNGISLSDAVSDASADDDAIPATATATATATAYDMANYAMSLIKKTSISVSHYSPTKLCSSMRTQKGFTLNNFDTNDMLDMLDMLDTNGTLDTLATLNRNDTDNITNPRSPTDIIDTTYRNDPHVSKSVTPSALPKEAKIYDSVYKHCKAINYILPTNTPEIAAVANNGITLKPLLDDFAQIAGTSAKNVAFNPDEITAALKKSSVVLIPGYGALCCGKTKDDAIAAQLVTQKACKALVGAAILGKVSPINPLECALMRLIYLKKYSKQIDQNHK